MTAGSVPAVALPRFLLERHRAEIEAAAGTRAELVAGDEPVLLEETPASLEVIVTGIDEVDRVLVGRNLWLDTSFTLAWFPAARFVEMARRHSIEKVLFGTDSPWADQGEEIQLHEDSGLTEEELAAVFYDNAASLLGI